MSIVLEKKVNNNDNNNNNNNNSNAVDDNNNTCNIIKDNSFKSKEWIFNFAMTILAFIVIFTAFNHLIQRKKKQQRYYSKETEDDQFRLLYTTIATLGVLMWPVLWQKLLGFDALTKIPLLWISFLWPITMLLGDIMYNNHIHSKIKRIGLSMIDNYNDDNNNTSDDTKSNFGAGHKVNDANMMIAITLGLGGILSTISNSVIQKSAKNLVAIALVLLVAFVIPNPATDSNTPLSISIGAIQRIFFNYGVGFLIASIALTFVKANKDDKNKPDMKSTLNCLLKDI